MDRIDLSRIDTLLGVWAHPDDEAYLSAGLMQRVIGRGGRVVCVTATRGERGTDDPSGWPPDRLGEHRIVELTEALRRLGVGPALELGLPDGGCQHVRADGPIEAIARIIDDVRPDAVVTFGPDGMTGHPDHIAVSEWTTAAWMRSDSAELLYATTTPEFVRDKAAFHRRHNVFPPGYPRPARAGEPLAAIGLDAAELARKRSVLDAHASQSAILVREMGDQAYTDWWPTEWFRRPRTAELDVALALEAAS